MKPWEPTCDTPCVACTQTLSRPERARPRDLLFSCREVLNFLTRSKLCGKVSMAVLPEKYACLFIGKCLCLCNVVQFDVSRAVLRKRSPKYIDSCNWVDSIKLTLHSFIPRTFIVVSGLFA